MFKFSGHISHCEHTSSIFTLFGNISIVVGVKATSD